MLRHGPPFADRRAAGHLLAEALGEYAGRPGLLVLAVPRGGVPFAHEFAVTLGAPLDVLVVRKLGAPADEELAIGAVASGGVRWLNPDLLAVLHVTPAQLEAVTARERAELARREQRYRGNAPFPDLRTRTVLLVDDGLATGATMQAAIARARALGARELLVAVPVASMEAAATIRSAVDRLVTLATPAPFGGVGRWYLDFPQTSDAEVIALLRHAADGGSAALA